MGYCCRIFTPVQPVYPAASLRDFLSGAYRPPATDADTREYHAMRGRKANRAAYLLIIPNQDHDDRFSRFTRLSLIDASKDGRQIILEFSGCSVLLEG